jgi:hypothetical protein
VLMTGPAVLVASGELEAGFIHSSGA